MKITPLWRFVLVWALGLVLAGCVNGPTDEHPVGIADNLRLMDANGQLVLAGRFDWPDGVVKPGQNFTGRWLPEFTYTKDERVFPRAWEAGADGWVKYHAEVASENMSVNLTFGQADNNLFLVANQYDDPASAYHQAFRGKWYYTTLAGMKEMGTFELRRNGI